MGWQLRKLSNSDNHEESIASPSYIKKINDENYKVTYGLRAVVGVHVHVTEVSLGVVHVLASIDLVELSLSILDFEGISSGAFVVLAEVRADEGVVRLSGVVVESVFEELGNTDERAYSPSDSHLSELRHAEHHFTGHPVASKPSHTFGTSVRLPD